jgi:RNA polymerase subunit RPABC4/transcription elongation factor Spt4
MRHIGANFFRQFKNKHLMDMFKRLCKETKHLMDMFKRLCKETNKQKFNKQWQKLDELTGKKKAEDASKNITA